MFLKKIIFTSFLICVFNLVFSEENEIAKSDILEVVEENKSENNENQEIDNRLIVSKVDFVGLKKTRNSYLQPKYKKYIGKTISEINLRELETELQLEGLFDKIEINFKENEDSNQGKSAIIEINVTEKITFIPLPFAMYSSSGFMAGLMVMDTNAFGVKDMFMFGGFYSTTSITGMAMFSKPSGDNFKPGYLAFLSAAKNNPEIKNIDDEDILDFENLSFRANFAIIESLNKYNSVRLSTGIGILSADENSVKVSSIDSAKIGKVGLSYSFSKNDWNGWFMSTLGASVSADFSKYFDVASDSDLSDFVQNYSVNLGFQKPVFSEKFRLNGHFAGDILITQKDKSAHISEYKDRGSVGANIFPGNFCTDKILSGSAGFELALKKFSFGLISIYGNYEVAWANDFSLTPSTAVFDDLVFCHGPNGGMRLYLSKIAFPALAFGLSYNITKSYYQSFFAMGISM